MILLNGLYVENSDIDPAKHKFIGRFRPAVNPMANPTGYIACLCGNILKVRGEEITHYNNGCCDINQYVDIDGLKSESVKNQNLNKGVM